LTNKKNVGKTIHSNIYICRNVYEHRTLHASLDYVAFNMTMFQIENKRTSDMYTLSEF